MRSKSKSHLHILPSWHDYFIGISDQLMTWTTFWVESNLPLWSILFRFYSKLAADIRSEISQIYIRAIPFSVVKWKEYCNITFFSKSTKMSIMRILVYWYQSLHYVKTKNPLTNPLVSPREYSSIDLRFQAQHTFLH